MKKVFEAKMTVEFGSSPRDLSKVNSFSSEEAKLTLDHRNK